MRYLNGSNLVDRDAFAVPRMDPKVRNFMAALSTATVVDMVAVEKVPGSNGYQACHSAMPGVWCGGETYEDAVRMLDVVMRRRGLQKART